MADKPRSLILKRGVPGSMGDGVWADVPERLAEQGFRCLAPTWPLGAHRVPITLADTTVEPYGVDLILSGRVEYPDGIKHRG